MFDVGGPLFLTIEATVNILDGPEAPAQHVQLFRQMQGKPTGPITWYGADLDEEAFTQAMVDEGRLVYEFVPIRAYGIYESVG